MTVAETFLFEIRRPDGTLLLQQQRAPFWTYTDPRITGPVEFWVDGKIVASGEYVLSQSEIVVFRPHA